MADRSRPAAYELPARVTVLADSLHQAIAALHDVLDGGVSFEAEHVDRVEVTFTVDPNSLPATDAGGHVVLLAADAQALLRASYPGAAVEDLDADDLAFVARVRAAVEEAGDAR